MSDFTVIIPARYASTRFPGKPLAIIKDKPMLQHVYERAVESGAKQIIIATDDARIESAAKAFGADVCMTSEHHLSGTTRLAEVISIRKIADEEIVVNVQGDEPFIPPQNIRQVADNLSDLQAFPMATLCFPINDAEDLVNPNVVKLVVAKNGKALYFSRSLLPYPRAIIDRVQNAELHLQDATEFAQQNKGLMFLRHIGIYAYRARFVEQINAMSDSMLEQAESLEQLRVLEHGHDIHAAIAKKAPPHGVDTPDDLKRLNEK